MAINQAIPQVSTEVRDKMLRFKQAGPSVEEARAAMLAAKEPVTTHGGGTRVPKFVQEGGNTPVVPNLLESAHQKIANLRVPAGAKINLNKMRDAGLITQPEIDALMAEANGKKSEPAPVVDHSDLIEEEPPAPAPVQAAPVEPERVPVAAPPVVPEKQPEVNDNRKTIETKQFTGYMYRDGKEWVAEIVYKNGAGTERFTADSKDSLMLKLLEGKGFGTVKVRDTVRRMKLGDKPDGWDFFFEQVKESHNLTIEQYNALPEASRALVQDTVQAQQILAFTESHPDYYATSKNFGVIADYLNKREWPLTLHNLEIAFADLTEDELLETRPIAAPPELAVAKQVSSAVAEQVSAAPVTSAVEDSPAVVAPPAPPAPAVVAQAPSVTVPRKRGSTGLIPGSSSAAPAAMSTEDGIAPKEPSESELRKMSDADLKRIATKNRVYPKY